MPRADRFLKACRREPVDCTPVWMMRQAGRYLPEYREIRAKHSFLEMCKTPELAAEVTIQPIRRYEIDAAIIFADILLPLEPMGIGLEFAKGEGPVIHNPVRTAADVKKLKPIDAANQIDYLMKAIKLVLKELNGIVPLIGFSGAPFTLASYMIEGGGSRNYENAKAMMFAEPKTWHLFMEHLTGVIINYMNAQIDAGVQVVQLFDSWVGALGPSDYREFVLPHQKNVIAGIKKSVPLIHFAHGATHLLEMVAEAGGDVVGLDWRCNLDEAWNRVGADKAVQGNIDPISLFGSKDFIRKRVQEILDRAGGRNGHIMNLGHGILQQTPLESAEEFINATHELSKR
ncbi:MAG: uroporphyrinogen decarboxylase [Nitrospirae bacterium GWC2_57_13]|jgi:uroporphyrinogen decarboxylase|nr:MAG: uroporphyrinogen decarboxylase [Nitrospirae bacterium GWC2_57_13]OGW43001.1 MAG: uroporphyrinogen decarboxylase [Nitrospirae bacterium GWD2_57_8]HAR46921.1 uroporphyrinogen decarboxylase [Nitrospiraceae bacterium]